ncbi:hypothetical protein TCAL_03693, partial [Tigriopus californicus]
RVLLAQNPQDEARRLEIQKQKEAQREFGVFFDDDYDYLQHMKDTSQVEHDWSGAERFFIQRAQAQGPPPPPKPDYRPSVQLPGQVFASAREEKVGILNQAAPHSGPLLDWDPDIVETLDDAYEHTVVFTLKDEPTPCGPDGSDLPNDEDDLTLDDFLADGQQLCSDDDGENADAHSVDFSSDFDPREAEDEVGSLDGRFSFSEEETQTRFTQYSMSSSVVARNEQLSQLDEQFEKFYDEYTEDNTGGLDLDEIEGHQDDGSDLMRLMVQAYQVQQAEERRVPDLKAEVQARLASDSEDDQEDEEELIPMAENPKERWDCESILSTYSNIYHRPKMISEPSRKVRPIIISSKTGMPEDALGKGLTKGALRQLDRDTQVLDDETCTLASRVSALSIRPKHETLEEKKNRKKAFQQFKRERRMEKKANTLAFKEEKALQERNAINNRKNIQGGKIL